MQTKTPIERLQALLPDVFEPKAQTGQLYLRVQMGTALSAALPLSKVVETLQVSASSLTPIPNMPASVLGLMGHQGKVLWAIDLALLLGINQGTYRPRQYNMVIVEMASTGTDQVALLLGFAVERIQNTLRLNPEEVQISASEQNIHLLPYLEGHVQQHGQEILVLDVDAISNADGLYAA